MLLQIFIYVELHNKSPTTITFTHSPDRVECTAIYPPIPRSQNHCDSLSNHDRTSIWPYFTAGAVVFIAGEHMHILFQLLLCFPRHTQRSRIAGSHRIHLPYTHTDSCCSQSRVRTLSLEQRARALSMSLSAYLPPAS